MAFSAERIQWLHVASSLARGFWKVKVSVFYSLSLLSRERSIMLKLCGATSVGLGVVVLLLATPTTHRGLNQVSAIEYSAKSEIHEGDIIVELNIKRLGSANKVFLSHAWADIQFIIGGESYQSVNLNVASLPYDATTTAVIEGGVLADLPMQQSELIKMPLPKALVAKGRPLLEFDLATIDRVEVVFNCVNMFWDGEAIQKIDNVWRGKISVPVECH